MTAKKTTKQRPRSKSAPKRRPKAPTPAKQKVEKLVTVDPTPLFRAAVDQHMENVERVTAAMKANERQLTTTGRMDAKLPDSATYSIERNQWLVPMEDAKRAGLMRPAPAAK